jgi:rubredoxin
MFTIAVEPEKPDSLITKEIINQLSSATLYHSDNGVLIIMDRYVCLICGHVYNPDNGEPLLDIKPGVAFTALPADVACPVCSASKDKFRKE